MNLKRRLLSFVSAQFCFSFYTGLLTFDHLVSPETEAVHLPRGGERRTDAALSFACAAVGALARRLVAYMC
jgi:hypothetical protein